MSVQFLDVLDNPGTDEAGSGYEDPASAGTSSGSRGGGGGSNRIATPLPATAGDASHYRTSPPQTADTHPDRGGFAPTSAFQEDLSAARFRLWRELAKGLDRIEVSRAVMGGEPVIRGTAITVAQLQQLAARGMDIPRIAEEFYGRIEAEDIRQAFQFAARLAA